VTSVTASSFSHNATVQPTIHLLHTPCSSALTANQSQWFLQPITASGGFYSVQSVTSRVVLPVLCCVRRFLISLNSVHSVTSRFLVPVFCAVFEMVKRLIEIVAEYKQRMRAIMAFITQGSFVVTRSVNAVKIWHGAQPILRTVIGRDVERKLVGPSAISPGQSGTALCSPGVITNHVTIITILG
jgi:hypothetical protein